MSTEDTRKQIKAELIAEDARADAQTGRLFPEEFIFAIRTAVAEALSNYLRAHGAPAQLIALLNDYSFLTECEIERAADGELGDVNARELYRILPAITKDIAEMGGRFHDGYGGYNVRREAPAWPGRQQSDLAELDAA